MNKLQMIQQFRPIAKQIGADLNKTMMVDFDEQGKVIFADKNDEKFKLRYNPFKNFFYNLSSPLDVYNIATDIKDVITPPEQEDKPLTPAEMARRLQRAKKTAEQLSKDPSIAKGIPFDFRTMKYDHSDDTYFDENNHDFRLKRNAQNEMQLTGKRFSKTHSTKEVAIYYCFSQLKTILNNYKRVNLEKISERFLDDAKNIIEKVQTLSKTYHIKDYMFNIHTIEDELVNEMCKECFKTLKLVTEQLLRFEAQSKKDLAPVPDKGSEPVEDTPVEDTPVEDTPVEEPTEKVQDIASYMAEVEAELEKDLAGAEDVYASVTSISDFPEDDFDAQNNFRTQDPMYKESFKQMLEGILDPSKATPEIEESYKTFFKKNV